ncbi:MAG: zinc-binding alcohol dehydrogenase, partial [Candidatus Electrothrix sp. AR3]|nr:zinc-binding alcohol dehydrogenase [Candidatus Electrothrix sp. AR3]
AVGDSVAVYPVAVCETCPACLKKQYDSCESTISLAHGLNGAYAEYIWIPKEIINLNGLIKLDEDISFEDAAMAEPLSRTFAAARANKMSRNQKVLIIGGGAAGLMHLKTAKWSGCEVIVTDLIDTRLAMAGQMGADHLINSGKENLHQEVMRITQERGVDVAIISVDLPDVIEDCFKLITKGGVCNIFSAAPGGVSEINSDWLVEQDITLTGIGPSSLGNFKKCLQLIQEEAIIVSDLISHRFTLDTFPEALERSKNQELVRGVITFGEMFSLSF